MRTLLQYFPTLRLMLRDPILLAGVILSGFLTLNLSFTELAYNTCSAEGKHMYCAHFGTVFHIWQSISEYYYRTSNLLFNRLLSISFSIRSLQTFLHDQSSGCSTDAFPFLMFLLANFLGHQYNHKLSNLQDRHHKSFANFSCYANNLCV